MKHLDVATVSSKGQVVIPGEIRERLGIEEGTKLVVLTDGSNLLLKPIEPPKWRTFRRLVAESRRLARATDLKKADVARALRSVRGSHRR